MQDTNKEILRIALPSIVSNITVPLLGLVDTSITGHMGSAAYIGAVAIGSMLFNTIYWLFSFLRLSTSGLTSQALGRGDDAEIARLLRSSLSGALTIALILVVLQVPLRMIGLWITDPSDEIAALTTTYFNICIWGAPASLGLFCLNGWFIGMQNSRIPMAVAITQNVVNILASLLFVYVLDMKVEGVALGTLIAQWCGFAVSFVSARRMISTRIKLFTLRSSLSTLHSSLFTLHSSLFTLNSSLFLRTLCIVSVMLFFTSAGSWQGATLLAVNTIFMQMFLLVSYVMDGFANAAEAMSGKYYGADDRVALTDTIRKSFLWTFGVAVVFTLTYAFFGNVFFSILTNEPTVVCAAADYMVWICLIPLVSFLAFIWDGVYIGLTAARSMLLATFIAAVCFFTVFFLTRSSLGNHGLWISFLVFLFMRGAMQTVLFRRIVACRK